MPYVYLIQPIELLGTNRYKVGMSALDNLSRVQSYKKGTRYLMICECIDYLHVERKIIKEFNSVYRCIAGNEYFEVGDELKMLNLFCNIVMTHKNSIDEDDLETKETQSRDDWMQRFAFKSNA